MNNRLVPVEGAKEMLAYLSGKYSLYVASNGYSVKQRERLKKAGMFDYFTDMFVSEETGTQKPQKEFFDYCFARMEKDLKPEEVMIIGDGLTSDMAGGNNAGIRTCWFNAYYADAGIEHFCKRGNTCRKSATPNRYKNDIDERQFLNDFHCD